MKLNFNFKKYINPAPAIGGLEISDLVIRLAIPDRTGMLQASVQIPPGIMNGGRVLDRAKFLAALKGLHHQIGQLKKILPVVVLIPTNNVYTQAFTMPLVAQKNIDETARLNLQSISPISTNTAYYGYQMIGETKKGQLEAIGAFVNSEEVDTLTGALKEAGFGVVAVEFPALAISRLIKNYTTGLKPDAPYLVAYIGSDGPDLMVIKGGNLYFSYFNSWAGLQQELGGRKISAGDVQDFLTRNIKQVMNFYTSRWGQPIQDVLLVDNPIAKDILETINKNFGLAVQPFQIRKYGQLSPLWYAAIGAMERGLIARSADKAISLTAVGVEQEYYRELTLGFIKAWRNIITGVLVFMSVALFIANLLLAGTVAQGDEDLSGRALVPLADIQKLQADVNKFNQTVDYALAAQAATPAWSPFYAKMKALTGSQVTIQRIFVDASFSVLMLGKGVNDSAVIAFKNTLSNQANFKDVALPLSNIKVNEDGTVSFSLNFKINSLKF